MAPLSNVVTLQLNNPAFALPAKREFLGRRLTNSVTCVPSFGKSRSSNSLVIVATHRHKKHHRKAPPIKGPKEKHGSENGNPPEEEHVFLEDEKKNAWHDALTGPVFWLFRTLGTVID